MKTQFFYSAMNKKKHRTALESMYFNVMGLFILMVSFLQQAIIRLIEYYYLVFQSIPMMLLLNFIAIRFDGTNIGYGYIVAFVHVFWKAPFEINRKCVFLDLLYSP